MSGNSRKLRATPIILWFARLLGITARAFCYSDVYLGKIIVSKENKMEKVKEIIELFTAIPPKWNEIRDLLGKHQFSKEELAEIAYKVTDSCFLERVDVENNCFRPFDETCHGFYVLDSLKLLLDFGLDPNVIAGENNIMWHSKHIDAPDELNMGAQALRLLLEHGGNPNLMDHWDGLTFFEDIDYYISSDGEDGYLTRFPFFLVLAAFGGSIEGRTPLIMLEGNKVDIFKDFELFDFKIETLPKKHAEGDWIVHIFNKNTKEEVAYYDPVKWFDHYKNNVFSAKSWSAPTIYLPSKCRQLLESYQLVGRKIEEVNVIGMCYSMTKERLEEQILEAQILEEYYSKEQCEYDEAEREFKTHYENFDSNTQLLIYAEIDEPFRIKFADGEILEILTQYNKGYRISMNCIPWDIDSGIKQPKVLINDIFNQCNGRIITSVEVRTSKQESKKYILRSLCKTDITPEGFISKIIIRFDDGNGLQIENFSDKTFVTYIDCDNEIISRSFTEIEHALLN